jgi:RNA polymerase-binding transcription factor DksA
MKVYAMLKKSNVASIAPGNLYRHEGQLEYFKHNLLDLQNEFEDELRLTRKYLRQEDLNDADLYDRASREINLASKLSKKTEELDL